MPDFKKDWPDMLYKIIMAILAIVFGYNQYVSIQEHKDFRESLQAVHEYLAAPQEDQVMIEPSVMEDHSDYLQKIGD